ncbi:MAG: hypothetical protein Q4C95_00845 [Planctomycetia bacterium]|nr:hypothetical protein [Planctomycetia bacterium]
MKNIGKILILFLVGVLMISISYPVSQTEWADGIRVQVQKKRKERRRMREQREKSSVQKGSETSSTPTLEQTAH